MNRILTLLLLSVVSNITLFAQEIPPADLSYYFGREARLDPEVPEPSELLGFQVGEWHASPDQLLRICETYSSLSERISMSVIGYSYERRPLVHLYITSPDNQAKLEDLRQIHLGWAGLEETEPELRDVPLVINLGFSVHGNEASGMNAAILLIYYLAASQDPDILHVLEDNIIIIDPCLNPDGSHRFATWTNMHRSRSHLNTLNQAREHQEVWPGGRTNHYWFDLNRDWLLLRHPESKARVREFHRWKPNILTDHHEMGSNRTFFFQPGIPSRNNPLTPPEAIRLTQKAAEVHAEYLDQIGSRYYSQESYDDFYYGKGSTYPDLQGGIGILFEQASARGHRMATIHGDLSFSFAIRNQLTTALSSIEFGKRYREELLQYQRDFFHQATETGKESKDAGYYLAKTADSIRTLEFVGLLEQHDIQILEDEGGIFVPLEQPQYFLIRSLFEPALEFQDSLFYDVSTWMMPAAFGLEAVVLSSSEARSRHFRPASLALPEGGLAHSGDGDVALAFDWGCFSSSQLLAAILQQGLPAYISKRPIQTEDGEDLVRGSIFVPLSAGQANMADIKLIDSLARIHHVPLIGFDKGLQSSIDLGSPQMVPARLPRVALVVGDGVAAYEAGEIWYMLDEVFHYPLTLIEAQDLTGNLLSDFSHLILVSGSSNHLNRTEVESWLRQGGTLITIKSGGSILNGLGINAIRQFPHVPDLAQIPYEDRSLSLGAQRIGGMICELTLDQTHPVAFGYEDSTMKIFKNSEFMWSSSGQEGRVVGSYAEAPVVSGYISRENMGLIAGSPAILADRFGNGVWISFADDPIFRGYWWGSTRLLVNALFFSHLMGR